MSGEWADSTAHGGGGVAGQVLVPYVTGWSGEVSTAARVVRHASGMGIAYADETVGDRDSRGVLWNRVLCNPGQGRPEFGNVNSVRQRRAMRRLLCQVCANPADITDDGALWLLKDHRDDWAGWPDGMGVTEPPICLPCLRVAVRACPALRSGYAVVRARRYEITGVYGTRYTPGWPVPTPAVNTIVRFGNPAIRWIKAVTLVRELRGSTILDSGSLAARARARAKLDLGDVTKSVQSS